MNALLLIGLVGLGTYLWVKSEAPVGSSVLTMLAKVGIVPPSGVVLTTNDAKYAAAMLGGKYILRSGAISATQPVRRGDYIDASTAQPRDRIAFLKRAVGNMSAGGTLLEELFRLIG